MIPSGRYYIVELISLPLAYLLLSDEDFLSSHIWLSPLGTKVYVG